MPWYLIYLNLKTTLGIKQVFIAEMDSCLLNHSLVSFLSGIILDYIFPDFLEVSSNLKLIKLKNVY